MKRATEIPLWHRSAIPIIAATAFETKANHDGRRHLGGKSANNTNHTVGLDANVDVADRQDLGPVSTGHRFIVPILGDRFSAGPGRDGLNRNVLAGGTVRQLLRPDHVKELDALYEMQIAGGPLITVHNQVIVDEARQPERYAMSTVRATVEDGPFDWLNRRLLIGALQSARPARRAVVIRAWEADVA